MELINCDIGSVYTQNHKTFIDVIGLFKSLSLAMRLFGHLAASQINEIDFSVTTYVDTFLWSLCNIIINLIFVNFYIRFQLG